MGNIKKKSITIGIDSKTNISYIKLLQNIFDIVNVFEFEEILNSYNSDLDLIIFTGGADVSPSYYNDNKSKYTMNDIVRDKIEFRVASKYPNIFKLGICRGAQLLTVVSNGILIQHTNGHHTPHDISIRQEFVFNSTSQLVSNYYDEDSSTFQLPMTSTHHQMMYPYNLNKDEYDLIAWSTYFLSDIYLNGSNEDFNLKTGFLEPEIVYYKTSNSLCIQGHPEYTSCEKDTVIVIQNLILKFIK
jgi:GMP synthase-like glutamine amidotransferase